MEVLELDHGAHDPRATRAVAVLEAGGLVVVTGAPFEVAAEERGFLDPAILTRSKNVSLDPETGAVSGVEPGLAADGSRLGRLQAMMARFSARAEALLGELTPVYAGALQTRRTSFRPGAVADRALSRRKDDRRLHIDAFPASPVQGRRILRVFANVDPEGRPRRWEVGEDGFEAFARRFAPRLKTGAGSSALLQRLGVTKGRRTAYDRAMLNLHDLAKLDDRFQGDAAKRPLAFEPGALWVVYTDAVLHAALAGQHALEQTFLLPVEAMTEPDRSPLRVLERLRGHALV